MGELLAATDSMQPLQRRSGRVLAVAYACDPYKSMESRVGWQRVIQAAQNHQVWVLHAGQTDSETLARYAAEQAPAGNIHFVTVPNCWLGSAYREHLDMFWPRYRLWQCQAKKYATELHKQHRFQLAHQINFCSFREPGSTWQLGIPFLWGPIGGTHALPMRFLTQCDFVGGCREVTRALINTWQLAASRRIRSAARSAAKVFAASREAQRDLERWLKIDIEVLLETGIGPPSSQPRQAPTPDRPFRLLWAGRQRTWKCLPLLTQALAKLPKSFNYELRVLGVGASHNRWRRQAKRLGVDDRIEWLGWPEYSETLLHYAWADAFVFTSLRDTSGTGLLESLAAGTPIIGLDHQGAADIMTPECAEPIAVHNPRQVIDSFAEAIVRLASDPQAWAAKSEAAKARSLHYQWQVLADRMEQQYQQVLAAIPHAEMAIPARVPNASIANHASSPITYASTNTVSVP